MKKIIIVGHNQENNEKLETLFQHFGMKKALPSRREGLTPIQVGELLSKAIKSQVPQVQEIDEEELPKKLPTHISKRRLKKNLKKQQNTQAASALPKSMWDYIPMDLMIANIDNEFWGWADKNALENLEYWKNLDPSIYFVLTYDQPQSLLHKLESENEEISKEIILEKLDDWNAYNTKMLDFFEKNPERAILINNERVKQQNNSSIKALYSQVVPNEFNQQEIVSLEELSMEQTVSESPISSVLFNTIINNSPEISETFSKLNQQANFPSVEYYNSDIDSVIDAWRENKNRTSKINEYKEEISSLDQKTNLLKSDLLETKVNLEKKNILYMESLAEGEKLKLKVDHSTKETLKYKKEKENILLEKNAILDESNKLLSELHCIQGEFDRLYSDNNKYKNDNATIRKELENIRNINKETIDENEKILQGNKKLILEIENNKDLLSKAIKEKDVLSEENHRMILELHSIQEEFERLYMQVKVNHERNLIYGAADRIKNQLEYRLGACLINSSTNICGIFKMPFSLMSVYSKYKKEYKEKRWNELPPLETYQDFQEGEKIKLHLSYRLGKVLMKYIKNPFMWLFIPYKLIMERSAFKKHKSSKK